MRELETADAPDSIGPYSQGVLSENRIYVSGQGPIDPGSGTIVDGAPAEQTRRTLRNVDAVLTAGGASLDDVVKATVYLRDIRHYEEVNGVYGDLFSEPYPARTAVEVSNLPVDIDVEIDVVAER
jgi:2-iminobutanoate/2-iminopropanoate deaminase